MSKNWLSIISLMMPFFGAPAFSSLEMVGEHVVHAQENAYPYFCSISIDGNDEENICSGTLIDAQTVVSAGHCFADGSASVSVSCGGRSMGRVLQVDFPNKKTWVNSTRPRSFEDVAVIHLKKKQTNQTLMPSYSMSEYFDELTGNLKPAVKCKMAGFGVNDKGGSGLLMIVDLQDLKLQVSQNVISLFSTNSISLATSVDHGDSGGPLYCSFNQEVPKLVGIIGGYRMLSKWNSNRNRGSNFFATTWLNLKK